MDDLEELRISARRNLERVQRSTKLATEQGVSWAKWLTASLLAVNGAGALGVLNAADKLHDPAFSGAVFVGGVLLALLSGWVLQLIYFQQIEFAESLEIFWERAVDTGLADDKEKQILEQRAREMRRWNWVPPAFGLCSALVFVAGAVVVAASGIAVK